MFVMRAEPVLLRVPADEQREPDPRQRGAEARLPERRALPRWRQIGAVDRTRVAKAYRNNGDARAVVERVAVHGQPGAQHVARGIVPGNARLVDAATRRLADDEQARAARGAKHRPRLEELRAAAAGMRLARDLEKRNSHPRII